VASLALAIGTNTTIFSVAKSLLYDQAIMTAEAEENSRRISLGTRNPTASAQARPESADSRMLGL
jgi:hypothetical protein